jgi:shikimate kinase
MSASTLTSTTPRPNASNALTRSLVLVGLMGAGKTSTGRRLARALRASFADADDEIVSAAGMSIPDIFAQYGEPAFRDLERRVVARLLDQPPQVLALGGGAFINPVTRERIKQEACSIWLRADLPILLTRTQRKRGTRPLLEQGDPAATLARLMEERYPIYAEADHVIDTTNDPPDTLVQRIIDLLGPRQTGP